MAPVAQDLDAESGNDGAGIQQLVGRYARRIAGNGQLEVGCQSEAQYTS